MCFKLRLPLLYAPKKVGKTAVEERREQRAQGGRGVDKRIKEERGVGNSANWISN